MQTNTAPSADSPRLQTVSRDVFWQQHITQWRQSGLSKMAYCQQYSLVYHQMVYWCSKTAKEDVESAGSSNDFVAVTISPAMQSPCGLSVRLPNGIAIEGIDENNVSLVSKLIELL